MMKKLLTILLGIALVLPLYSQEDGLYDGEYDDVYDNEIVDETTAGEDIASENYPYPAEEEETEEEPAPKPEKKKSDFARQYFEMGFDAGGGFDNGLVGFDDILQKKIVIDLSKIAQGVSEDGAGLNIGLAVDFFMNVKNIHIGKGIWDFGFIADAEGGVNVNISKSLFTLISEGNADRHDSSGSVSASGGIFTELGLKGSAKYKVAGRTLYVGVKPAIFTPAVYIPSSSEISYDLKTRKGEMEGIFVNVKGEIEIYTASSLEKVDPGRFVIGPSGFDMSLEGEYALFPFLDVGGSFTNIPFAAATLTNRLTLSMPEINIDLAGNDLIAGKGPDVPEMNFEETYSDSVKKEVRRPFRFDVYARYKPFNSELLVLRPNIGFTVNATAGDEKGFFNAGLEARLNLINMFTFYLGSGYRENLWKHRAGLGLNFRAFELDLEAALRDQTFAGCFMGRCFDINLGMRFGW